MRHWRMRRRGVRVSRDRDRLQRNRYRCCRIGTISGGTRKVGRGSVRAIADCGVRIVEGNGEGHRRRPAERGNQFSTRVENWLGDEQGRGRWVVGVSWVVGRADQVLSPLRGLVTGWCAQRPRAYALATIGRPSGAYLAPDAPCLAPFVS